MKTQPLGRSSLTISRLAYGNMRSVGTWNPAEVTAERFGVRLSRATVLVAGASILLGAIDRYRLPRLRVAAGGLREGVALASWYAGPAWRSEITTLARGWDR